VKISVLLPFDKIEKPAEFLTADAVREVSGTIERAGFSGCWVTDHPVPTGRWLDAGGHHAQDPFVILSLVAAATQKLRLQTGIVVLPYRNPFITARAVATLDVFSGGRVGLGVGAGYLKAEYKAVGADFNQRNEIMDEYLRAMKAAWASDEFVFEGTGYQALGNRILPRPLQRPHPPLLIGGNSRRAIRRAVDLGDVWNPFMTMGALPATSRTAALADEADLATGSNYMREYCEKVGRKQPPEIVLSHPTLGAGEPQVLLDQLGKLAGLGVVEVAVGMDGHTRAEWCDNAKRFGADVIAKLR
jgi:probable F420-dependent oxidoreductase